MSGRSMKRWLLAASVVTGLAIAPAFSITPASAACALFGECFGDDDEWYEENCYEDPEDGTCCHCPETGKTACAKVGLE